MRVRLALYVELGGDEATSPTHPMNILRSPSPHLWKSNAEGSLRKD